MASRNVWSRPLPERLKIPGIPALKTLADVRALIKRLPREFHQRETWRYVETVLADAAAGRQQPVDAAIALRLVLMLERVPCRVG